jgi:SAM-dependent methyltransferase
MHPTYLALRVFRRLLPSWLTRRMLEVGFILQPGLETREPEQAVERYLATLRAEGLTIAGRDVLVFGYGGDFGVGVLLLRAGAASVTLCDRFARPSRRRNARWVAAAPEYFRMVGGVGQPDGARLRALHEDIRGTVQGADPAFDVVLSSSVFEHLDDVEGVVVALAALTRQGGIHLHYIDVRDHYFRLPFEMLTFPEVVWRRYLNPGSNLNRLRPWKYEDVFCRSFSRVTLEVIQAERDAFLRARRRIRPEFLSGDEAQDSAGVILLTAAGPLRAGANART